MVRVGILGYGKLGQFLAQEVIAADGLELAFVWNRSSEKVLQDDAVAPFHLARIEDFESRNADLIIEVAHPQVVIDFGHLFLSKAALLVGSPTAFADSELEKRIRSVMAEKKHHLFIPAGAFWGADDILKMDMAGKLASLKVTMRKHPSSFKLGEPLKTMNDNAAAANERCVLYEGPVRPLCPLAPNNVNTMACAALAAVSLGFDRVQACLVSDPSLEAHIVEIDATSPASPGQVPFSVKTVRYNPAAVGAVTGNATFVSFGNSLIKAFTLLSKTVTGRVEFC